MTGHTIVEDAIKDRSSTANAPFDLRSPDLLAKNPIIGVILFIIGGLIFGGLTYNLFAHGPLIPLDNSLAKTLPAQGLKDPPIVKYVMNAAFYLGKEVVSVYAILHALYFLVKKYWKEFWMFVIGVLGCSTVFFILTNLINRPRPSTQIWIHVGIPGFPSGHTSAVVACFGLMAYLAIPKIRSRFWKWFWIAITILAMAYVGFSRVFTAGHYLTDAIAGYGLGLAWSALVYTLIELYFQKRRSRNA